MKVRVFSIIFIVTLLIFSVTFAGCGHYPVQLSKSEDHQVVGKSSKADSNHGSRTFAYRPMIINVVLDGSASISGRDLGKEKLAVIKFVKVLYARSQIHGGQLCDWLSINYFGGDNDYDGTKFVNCSDEQRMSAMGAWVYAKEHPKYGNTAIYTAIGKAFVEIGQHEQNLKGKGVSENTYVKNIILITDGQDNSKNERLKNLVKRTFPTEHVNLFLIGVGSESNLKQFDGIADTILMIANFDELIKALLIILGT